ncbi:lipopolysaccharide biosynthesis protein [Butyrivibrio sp. XPD2002]|uniref:lipopolysaccharide biosynthesis protein n=1 Tax=Butyrivibrio sp. XPD2002 TaxID=1280665 RepID=UPI0003FE6053|nr:lipopolysaccharide biosynthesis protein [Butyrivibrio sp. XPD2002]
MVDNRQGATKVFSGLMWVYLENISAQIVNFIVSIVLARLLEPSYYGTIALVNVFVNLANVFVTSSFSYALIQKKDADEIDYSTMFWFITGISFVFFVGLFIGSPAVGEFYNNPELGTILRVLALRIPLSAYNSVQMAYVSSHMVFKKSFLSNSGGALLSGIFGVVLAYLGYGIWALVAQSLLNVLFNTIILMVVVKWRPQFVFSIDRLVPLIRYGWKLLATGLMFTGYAELRSLIIGKRYSAEDLGFYDRGYSFPRLIAANIDSTINRVLFPALSKQQDDSIRLCEMTRRAAKTSAYLMTPFLFGLAIVAEPLVNVLLGGKWMPCIPYIQIMSIMWWLQPTQTCSAQAIKAIGKSDVYLRIEIISKICGLILLAGAVFVINSVKAIAMSMLIGQIIAVLIYGVYVSRFIGYSLKSQFIDIFIPGMIGVVMCIPLYFIPRIVTNSILCIMIQVCLGSVIYICLSIILKIEEFRYLKGLIAKRTKKE